MDMNKKCKIIGYWVGDMATVIRVAPVNRDLSLNNDLFWFKNKPDVSPSDTLTFKSFYNNCASGKWKMYKQEKFYTRNQIPNDVLPVTK